MNFLQYPYPQDKCSLDEKMNWFNDPNLSETERRKQEGLSFSITKDYGVIVEKKSK